MARYAGGNLTMLFLWDERPSWQFMGHDNHPYESNRNMKASNTRGAGVLLMPYIELFNSPFS